MNLLDIIILAVVLIGFVLGFKDGFVRKLIGFLGFALAIFLAAKFAVSFGKIIEKSLGIELYLSQIIAGILIFLVVMIITSLTKRLIHPFDKVNGLVNQIIGGAVGTIQILFFLSAVFFLLNIFNAPSKNAIKESIFYKKVFNIIPVTINYLNNYTPETKKIFKDYFNEKDSVQ
ncbi:MAG: CvpA family protein [Ignavibacteriaceae bacterium]